MADTAGKNKLELSTRLWYDDSAGTPRDLSCDMVPGSLAVNGFTYNEVNMTGVCNAVENFLAGRATIDVTAQFFVNNTADTGAYIVLTGQDGNNASSGNTLTIQFGDSGNDPSTGAPELEGEFGLFGIPMSNNGGAWIMTATFKPNTSTAPAWGTMA